jgi:2,6-dihydroxypyridine 3-monooxygenase
MKATIVGGSIGGLTAALLLSELGYEVEVYERSPSDLEGRGAGIVLHRVSGRYLSERLGLGLDEFSEKAPWFRFLEPDGTISFQVPCRYRFTAWNSLYRPLRAALGEGQYHLGEEVVGLHPQVDGAVVELAGGGLISAPLVVAADGIASTIRGQLLPQAVPVFAGYLGWRGVVKESELEAARFERLYQAITYFTPPHSHILSYPIPAQGERLLNYVWYRNLIEPLDQVMTDRQGELRRLSVPPGMVRPEMVEELRTEAARALPPDLAAMVIATEQPFIQAVVDVEVERMVMGRVALVGDAAFVARPHTAAGTAKAAADAWELAGALATTADVDTALGVYEPAALTRGQRLVERARRLGTMAQVEGRFRAGDPEIIFGLDQPGDSCFDE